jgi:glycerol-3-phosphate O-acyltransferase/dihydroxyacetone phosphate acyltransferase
MGGYSIFKVFCQYTSSLVFRDIEVIHLEHVPAEGPTIVYGNHNNQFIDGIVRMS